MQVDGVISSGGPGVASDFEEGISLNSAQTVTVNSRAINCPGDGFVVAIAAANFADPTNPPGALDDIILGITTSLGSIPTAQQRVHRLESGAQGDAITIHEILAVSAGSTTIRFRVDDGQNFVVNARLTLMYFPTTYGAVDIP